VKKSAAKSFRCLILFLVVSTLCLFLSACPFSTNEAETHTSLVEIDSFLYQLQYPETSRIELEETDYNLLIIDYSETGDESGIWSSGEIASLKNSGGGKILLAYISIGEAETYRYYWDRTWSSEAPSWLGQPNPDWDGNFKVKYWEAEWQAIIFDYIDTIIDQGFDGIYMDIVDSYWYWAVEALDSGENEQLSDERDAADKMVDFISAIAAYCRLTREKADFILCPQNGTAIIWDAGPEKTDIYWETIDAIGVEDTFYYGEQDMDNPYNPQTDVIEDLEEYVANGKPVFATDYLSISNRSSIDTFYEQCIQKEYIPFAAGRELETLRINTGHEPN
jgi:cysteinyl-tRNA synthetase, unknown class